MTDHWIRKTLLFACATLASSLILSFAVGEFVVRHVNPQRTYAEVQKEGLHVFAESDIVPFTLLPNTRSNHLGYTREFDHGVTINNVGIRRTTDLVMPKPKGTYRILLLGDSMAFGWGVEDDQTFAAVLEKFLNDASAANDRGVRFEVLNAGFAAGFTVDGYYAYLVNIGKDFEPDLVIATLFFHNDIKELVDTVWTKTDSGDFPTAVSLPAAKIRGKSLTNRIPTEWKYVIPGFRNSHLAMLLGKALEQYSPKTSDRVKRVLGVKPDIARVSDEENRQCIYEGVCDERMSEMKERAKRVLTGMKRRAEEMNAAFFVLLLPEQSQTTPVSSLSEKKKQETLSTIQPQREFRELFDREKVPFFDLLPVLSESKSEPYFYERDGHLNAHGHEVVAHSLLNFVNSRFPLTKDLHE